MDWRKWTAADRAAVAFLILKRISKEPDDLRELYELVEDYDAIGAMDRDTMGQDRSIAVTDIAVRGGGRG